MLYKIFILNWICFNNWCISMSHTEKQPRNNSNQDALNANSGEETQSIINIIICLFNSYQTTQVSIETNQLCIILTAFIFSKLSLGTSDHELCGALPHKTFFNDILRPRITQCFNLITVINNLLQNILKSQICEEG